MTRAATSRVRSAAIGLAFAFAPLGCGERRSVPSPSEMEVLRPVSAAAPPAAGEEPPDDDPPPPASATTETVTIKLLAEARRQAHVFWGRKDLGVAPLEITRPRGSGPLDLLVLAPGAVPLHTRVFTDRNDTLALRLYGDKDASGLLGWAPPDAAADKKPRR